ncbi:hypothetical protein BWI96_00255 [Siphonobacter sp. SORGH_AS_0500]|uniref:TonB-dependent receptor plug domain-containing protein n=1 Tax=Siphonobacter sp. SORGH_AS_0500 TaxID=1864824 RepID=UPI000CA6D526|nr:TonB-dependent receptor plug domain-containing protein [Siphonobacter sp. SORGH_AS_0500]PKK38263.1 hypothetical protein BWI96_00255 [Siphonobacter sp. SORGH_AS_0500]
MKNSKILILSATLLSLLGASSCNKRSEVVPTSQEKVIKIGETTSLSSKGNRIKINGLDKNVVILVNDKVWSKEKLEKDLTTDQISSVEVFKKTPDNFIQKNFGDDPEILSKAKNGVLHITTKDQVKIKSSGKTPIILVNGKEVTQDQMNAIDPNTIEKVNVLKGEQALSQYGEKAKDGVVVITLKK